MGRLNMALSKVMETIDEAQSTLLAWLREGATNQESPALPPVPGTDSTELRQLTRLASVLRCRLSGDAPGDLVDALTADNAIQPSQQALDAFDQLLTGDAVVNLANLYAEIVAPEHRRPLGTFFTPRDSAAAIIEGYMGRHGAPEQVVDVGAGVGIFSEIARAAWPEAVIHAVDVNPLTLGLQAVATADRAQWNVELELADYSQWLNASTPAGATLYLGNPPYTRWQLLDASDRTILLEATGGLGRARSNLSTLFLAMTLNRMRPQDSLAMIIPAGWMRADYGKKIRSHLRGETKRRVSLRMADSWRFEGAIVDAVLVEVGPRESHPQPIEATDWSGSERISVSRLVGELPFQAPGRVGPTSVEGDNDQRLSDFAHVTRGTATGAHAFFVRNTLECDERQIPLQYRRALARRLRPGSNGIPALDTAELLVLQDYVAGAAEQLDEWIEKAEMDGLDRRHLCAKRKRWYDLSHEVKSPDVILSALARDDFHLLENDSGLAITNNLFGMYWKPFVGDEQKFRIVEWLRSSHGQAELRAGASVEANGLHRLSPKGAGATRLPDLRTANAGIPLGSVEVVASGKGAE